MHRFSQVNSFLFENVAPFVIGNQPDATNCQWSLQVLAAVGPHLALLELFFSKAVADSQDKLRSSIGESLIRRVQRELVLEIAHFVAIFQVGDRKY